MSNYYDEKYAIYSLINSLTDKYLFAKLNGMSRYTKKDFDREYPDDDACLEVVFKNRYKGIRWCPKCGAETKFYRVKKRQSYACMHCGYQLFPLAGTIFRKTTTPLRDWFYAIYLVSVAKNGVSAKELERHLGVTYKTAWRMLKQIRLLMTPDEQRLVGIVEADETYVGGKSDRGRSYHDKTPVVGIAEKRGKIKARVIDGASAYTVMPYLKANIEPMAVLHTDKSKIYTNAFRDFKHLSVDHAVGRYSVNGVNTNNLEGFWSQLKRSINGTYHSVSPKYLDFYVSEFVFRHNHRFEPVCPALISRAVKPAR